MKARNTIGALLAAGALVMAFNAVAFAGGAPAYAVEINKSADPTTVPAGGGDVDYTITVENTGTGFFGNVVVDDGMAGCTLAGPTGDQDQGQGSGKLEEGETWTYTCTVADVDPDTENTATVFACNQGGGSCDSENADATDTDSVTVGEDEDGGPGPTQSTTDTLAGNASSRADLTWLLIAAAGMLLASIVALRPARARDR